VLDLNGKSSTQTKGTGINMLILAHGDAGPDALGRRTFISSDVSGGGVGKRSNGAAFKTS
jgi:hypothetical protein